MRTLTVTPVTSILYQQFVTYLIQKSVNALIDPQLITLIKKTPQEAKKEFIAIGFFIPGIIFFFIVLFKVIFYTLTPNDFALIMGIIFVGIVLIGINLIMYVSSANGKVVSNRLKIMGAILLNSWLIFSVISFFAFGLYHGRYCWVIGHRNINNGTKPGFFIKQLLTVILKTNRFYT